MGGALKDSLLIAITELLCCSEELLISERAGRRAKDTYMYKWTLGLVKKH